MSCSIFTDEKTEAWGIHWHKVEQLMTGLIQALHQDRAIGGFTLFHEFWGLLQMILRHPSPCSFYYTWLIPKRVCRAIHLWKAILLELTTWEMVGPECRTNGTIMLSQTFLGTLFTLALFGYGHSHQCLASAVKLLHINRPHTPLMLWEMWGACGLSQSWVHEFSRATLACRSRASLSFYYGVGQKLQVLWVVKTP